MKRRLQFGQFGEVIRPTTRVDHLLRDKVDHGAIVLALTASEAGDLMLTALAARVPSFDNVDDEQMRSRMVETFERNRAGATQVAMTAAMTPWQAHPDHLRAVLAALVEAAYDVADGHGDVDDLRDRAEEAEALAGWFDDPQAALAGELFVPNKRPVGPDDVVTQLLDQAARDVADDDTDPAGDGADDRKDGAR